MKKIDISPLLIAAICLLFYCLPLSTVAPFLLACCLHEAGHIILCKLFHVRITSFSLTLSGAELSAQFRTHRQEGLCVLAGPAVNLLCLGCFFRFPMFALANLLLGIYNLFPSACLDGGRLLFLVLQHFFAYQTAEKAAALTELIFSCLLLVCAVVLCCVYHAGLWCILVFGLLFAKSPLSENILLFLPQRRKIKKKPREGAL